MDRETFLKYARFAQAGYPKNNPDISGYSITGVIDIPSTGGYARVYENSGEVIVAFAGTDGDWQDFANWPFRGKDQYMAMHVRLEQIVSDAKNSGKSVSFTGDSLGGFLAQMAAVQFGTTAVVFNTDGILESNISLAEGYRNERIYFDNQDITYVNYDGEFLHEIPGGEVLGPIYTIPNLGGEIRHVMGLGVPIWLQIYLHSINYVVSDLEAGINPVEGEINVSYYIGRLISQATNTLNSINVILENASEADRGLLINTKEFCSTALTSVSSMQGLVGDLAGQAWSTFTTNMNKVTSSLTTLYDHVTAENKDMVENARDLSDDWLTIINNDRGEFGSGFDFSGEEYQEIPDRNEVPTSNYHSYRDVQRNLISPQNDWNNTKVLQAISCFDATWNLIDNDGDPNCQPYILFSASFKGWQPNPGYTGTEANEILTIEPIIHYGGYYQGEWEGAGAGHYVSNYRYSLNSSGVYDKTAFDLTQMYYPMYSEIFHYNSYYAPPQVIQPGPMIVDGGGGNDTIVNRSESGITILGGDGNDYLAGGVNADAILGGDGDDCIYGFDSWKYSSPWQWTSNVSVGDTLNGGAGNDELYGYGATYIYTLGSGSDYIYDYSPNGGQVLMQGITINDLARFKGGYKTLMVSSTREQLSYGGKLSFVFDDMTISSDDLEKMLSKEGTDQDNYLTGTDDNDIINGYSGNDYLDGRKPGNDTLNGGDGDDILIAGVDSDILIGGYGNDWLVLRDSSAKIIWGKGDGNDTINNDLTPMDKDVFAAIKMLGVNDQPLSNNSSYNNILQLTGIKQEDVLFSIDKNDVIFKIRETGEILRVKNWLETNYVTQFVFDDGTVSVEALLKKVNLISELTGSIETESYSTGDAAISGQTLSNLLGLESLRPDQGNDTIIGGIDQDYIYGGLDNDTMIAVAGNDTYIVDAGDTVIENAGEGIDTVQADFSCTPGANLENLILTGLGNINSTGNDLDNIIIGNNGSNVLSGGEGNNTLLGGMGDDYMDGDAGNDTYIGGSGLGRDTLQFQNLVIASVTFTRNNNDLVCTITQTGEELYVSNWMLGASYQIEQMQFSDGTLASSQVNQKIA